VYLFIFTGLFIYLFHFTSHTAHHGQEAWRIVRFCGGVGWLEGRRRCCRVVRGHLQELGRGCWGLGGLCVWWRSKGKRKDGLWLVDCRCCKNYRWEGRVERLSASGFRRVCPIVRRVIIFSSLHDLRFDEDQDMGVGLIIASLLREDFWSVHSWCHFIVMEEWMKEDRSVWVGKSPGLMRGRW